MGLLVMGLIGFSNAENATKHCGEQPVYICDSSGATKYHLTAECRGLNACDSKIIKVTQQDAYDRGKKTLCGWED